MTLSMIITCIRAVCFPFSLRFSVSRYILLSRVNFILVDEQHKKCHNEQKIDKKFEISVFL